MFRAAEPADLPAGKREGLPGGGDGQGALRGARQGGHRDVPGTEGEVFVDLVGDDDGVVPDGELDDAFQHFAGEHRAGGVVRVVDAAPPWCGC